MKTAAKVVSGVLLLTGASALAQTSEIYQMTPLSQLDEIDCTGPCQCLTRHQYSSLTGTLILTQTSVDPIYTNYSVRAIAWDASTTTTGHIVGSGTFRRGGEVAIQQQMTLTLMIDGQTWTVDSGLVAEDPQHPFPELSVFMRSPIVGCRQDTLALDAVPLTCYANCDLSTTSPQLNIADFTCFLTKFAAGDAYANCDGSTGSPSLNVADFTCYLQAFAAGCP